ncbi:MAG: LysR family transcriptional regulator [Hyphomicrobiales bacterium]|nr:LysR family transcriptional regulator [Hyphomicrobiales bacterium]MCP5373105.1 LysR family transcriptional regulator [Hyphomicrobiales bacterium]
MDWDKLRVFHAVAEAGSFTHAGEALHLSQSAVSRQISSLEESLEVQLFHRHARGLILTEQGEQLFRTAHEVYAKLAMAEARINETRDRPQGPLRITTTVAFGSVWLTSRIKEFIELYPNIEVSIVLTDGELDLSMREADVAIRLQPPTQAGLVQRRLMTMRSRVYAAPEYLSKYGTPRETADLDDHRLVVYGDVRQPVTGTTLNWLLEAGEPEGRLRQAVLRVNNVYGIFRAVQSGLGIGALPEYMGHESVDLVEILPELRGPSFDTYFVYPEELRHSKRIAVFRDFLLEKVAEGGFS